MALALALFLLMMPSQSLANPNKAPDDCTSCHNAVPDANQLVYVAIDGTVTSSVTVAPGGSFQLDWLYENVDIALAGGVAGWIGGPAWTYGSTTVQSNPASLNGHAWNIVWDNASSIAGSGTPGWIGPTAVAGGAGIPALAASYSQEFTDSMWEDSTGAALDSTTPPPPDQTLCETNNGTWDAATNFCLVTSSGDCSGI